MLGTLRTRAFSTSKAIRGPQHRRPNKTIGSGKLSRDSQKEEQKEGRVPGFPNGVHNTQDRWTMGSGHPALTASTLAAPARETPADMKTAECVAEVPGYMEVVAVARDIGFNLPENNLLAEQKC